MPFSSVLLLVLEQEVECKRRTDIWGLKMEIDNFLCATPRFYWGSKQFCFTSWKYSIPSGAKDFDRMKWMSSWFWSRIQDNFMIYEETIIIIASFQSDYIVLFLFLGRVDSLSIPCVVIGSTNRSLLSFSHFPLGWTF